MRRCRLTYQNELQRLYDYDRNAPLDLKEHGSEDKSGLKALDVSYLSPKGGRVPAFLTVPSGKGLFAGVILFQNGRYDENVPQERAAQYHQAASDPKEVKWYNAGHSLNEDARRDRTEWLIRILDVK